MSPGASHLTRLCVNTSLCAWGVYRGHQVQELTHCTIDLRQASSQTGLCPLPRALIPVLNPSPTSSSSATYSCPAPITQDNNI